MTYKVVVAPAVEPISLAEAKAQCSIDGSEFDTLLTCAIMAARQIAEHETGRALCTQTRELILDAFPSAFVLRGAPIQSLVSIKFLDETGIEQTLDPQDTLLDKDSEPGYLVPAYGKAWPASYPIPNAVRVRYVCGYGDASAVPQGIKSWMLLAIDTLLENRSTAVAGQIGSLPDRFWHRLLDPYLVFSL